VTCLAVRTDSEGTYQHFVSGRSLSSARTLCVRYCRASRSTRATGHCSEWPNSPHNAGLRCVIGCPNAHCSTMFGADARGPPTSPHVSAASDADVVPWSLSLAIAPSILCVPKIETAAETGGLADFVVLLVTHRCVPLQSTFMYPHIPTWYVPFIYGASQRVPESHRHAWRQRT
jgi:hypothetical protein